MALDVLGYAEDHPARVAALRQFERLIVDDGQRFLFQPCFSPVWDTAIAAYSLAQAGVDHVREMRRAADWLLSKEVRRKGDWRVKRPGLEPSGWAFEFNNEFYPDIDDTAMVLLALAHAPAAGPRAGFLLPSRAGLGARYAVPRRRLGGVRCRQQLGVPEQHPLRRSQRHAGPLLSGHHRPRAGGAVRARDPPGASRRAARTRLAGARPAATMEAGTDAGASPIFTAPALPCAVSPPPARATAKSISCARANGCAPSRTPTADGAKAAPATITGPSCPPAARPRKPPGRCSA